MYSIKKTSVLISLFTVSFYTLIKLNPGHGYSDFLFLFSTAAAVIFGIFIVFSVSSSRDRLNRINELLKIEDANNLLLYKLSGVFGEKTQHEVRGLIDNYLIDQIDYRLEDFNRSGNSFHKLYEYIIRLEYKNKTQEIVLSEMIAILTTSSSNRIQIETIVVQRLSKFEWISTWGLTFVIVSHLYEMSHHEMGVLNTILLTILASSSVLLVLVLRDLNDLKWQKDVWTWKPLNRLFVSMELLPYYPGEVVESGEAKIPNDEKIRLAHYPNPYPDMTGKTIEVVEYYDIRKSRQN